jgi:N-acetylcysteine deacetylase
MKNVTLHQQGNEKLLEKLTNMRRELHEYPELSMMEIETTKRIRRWLEEGDIDILPFENLEVGVIAEIKGAKPGPTIAIRADIDALPIKEETNLPFSSKVDGVMHACGHDFHTASIIGTALLLKEKRDQLQGTVRFIFQPAEEIASGAKKVIEAGALEGVEAIFGMHNKPDLPVGTVGIREGALMASVDRFEIDVIGVGGHAGIPNSSIDSIVTASSIVTSLQSVVSRNVSSLQNAVVSICNIHGGSSWNVLPDKVYAANS